MDGRASVCALRLADKGRAWQERAVEEAVLDHARRLQATYNRVNAITVPDDDSFALIVAEGNDLCQRLKLRFGVQSCEMRKRAHGVHRHSGHAGALKHAEDFARKFREKDEALKLRRLQRRKDVAQRSIDAMATALRSADNVSCRRVFVYLAYHDCRQLSDALEDVNRLVFQLKAEWSGDRRCCIALS